jgi:hypothetical protein
MVWWNSTPVLTVALLVFVTVYLDVYWRIVRFKSPGWMAPSRESPATAERLNNS